MLEHVPNICEVLGLWHFIQISKTKQNAHTQSQPKNPLKIKQKQKRERKRNIEKGARGRGQDKGGKLKDPQVSGVLDLRLLCACSSTSVCCWLLNRDGGLKSATVLMI